MAPIDSVPGDAADLVPVLVSSAALLNGLIGELMERHGHLGADEIALDLLAKLCAVSTCLGSDTVAVSTPETRKLAEELLIELERIATWPARSRQFTRRPIQDTLMALDKARSSPRDDILGATGRFLAEAKGFVKRAVVKTCELMIARFPSGPLDDETHAAADTIPQHVTEDLLAAVWSCSVCSSCEGAAEADRRVTRYHPTRLYLGRPQQTRGISALFDIVIPFHSLEYWQEIGLRDSLPQPSPGTAGQGKKRVRFPDLSPDPPLQRNMKIKIPDFCGILKGKRNARVFLELSNQSLFGDYSVHALHHDATPGEGMSLDRVLRDYHLSVPQRIMLSHTIASAFWQLYRTKMMLERWTSRTIWFMPRKQDPRARLPCRTYISFPFDRGDYELEEYSSASLIHKCPRIFALAVLLLEISLVQPIQTSQLRWDERDFVGHANIDYATATKRLDELRSQSWENYTGKRIYDQAVDECMTGSNFSPSPQAPWSSMTSTDRQDTLYENVVLPLQYLASSFPPDSVADIERKNNLGSSENPVGQAAVAPDPVDELVVSAFSSYHMGKVVNPDDWLEDLKRISHYVYKMYQKSAENSSADDGMRPIRVAILDSGCNPETQYFNDDETAQRKARIKGWKDFVDRSETAQDSFGHGTLMAKLVIETSVTADLYLARVSRDTGHLEGSEAAICKAIRWAGIECEADIISMAFGVDDNGNDIKKAILEVRVERDDSVIFLASAGNSGPHEDVARPACYGDVISIRATSHLGTVAATNPAVDPDGPVPFATFGDSSIPCYLCDYKPEVCEPGSSVSTAVAAGIAATMLLYVSLISPNDVNGRLKRLRSVDGMKALFKKLSTRMGGRVDFINPVKFFADRQTNFDRLCGIVDCITTIR